MSRANRGSLLRVSAIAVFMLAAALATPARADSIPDFNLYICQSCSSPPSAPTLITNLGAFDAGDGGNHASASPLLIILGVYDGGNGTAPIVTFGSNTYSPGGTAIYGWSGGSTAVTFDSSSSGSAYAALGISPQGGGASEQFSNWNMDLTSNSLPTATSFSLYVYELSGVTLPANGSVTIDIEGTSVEIPIGSFVIGYACEDSTSPCPNGKEGATPNTTSGIVDAPPSPVVPEPSTLIMLGSGLLALGGMFRRRLGIPG